VCSSDLSPNKIEALRKQGYNKNLQRAAGAAASFIPFGRLMGAPAQTGTIPVPPTGPQPMGGAPIHPQQGPNLGLPAQIPTQGTAQPQRGQNLLVIAQDPEFKAFVQHKIDMGTEGPLEQMIKEFKEEKKKSPLMKGIMEQAAQMEQSKQIPLENKEEIAELSLKSKPENLPFISPEGHIGEIKSERNGKVLLEDNGKLHQAKKDELIQSPLQEKDLADLHDELVKATEKHTGTEVSRNVNWAGYDPETNELFYLPHLGDGYVYEKIPSEEVAKLTNVMNKRKTSGQNFIGAWEEGSKSPIGAAISELIMRLQGERGRGKEYRQKFKTIYDALEPAKRASKQKLKRQKNER
jgi:hypothetical protein